MDKIYCIFEGRPAVLVLQETNDPTYNLYYLKKGCWYAGGWMSTKQLQLYIETKKCIIDKNIEVLYE